MDRSARVRPAATSGSLLLEMLLDLVVLLAIVAAALALVDLPPGLRLSAQVLAGLMGVAVALLAVALRARDTVARLAAEPLARCPDALAAFLRESAAHLGAGIAAFAGVRTLARTGATSIATWGLMGAAYYLLGQALHVPISYPEMLLLAAVANLAVSVPAAAGGVGPFEVAMVQTLAALGAGGALGGAYVVALRGLLAGPVLALGLAALWWSRRRQRAAALTADALTAAANMSPPLAAGAPHLRVLPNDEAPAAMPRAA